MLLTAGKVKIFCKSFMPDTKSPNLFKAWCRPLLRPLNILSVLTLHSIKKILIFGGIYLLTTAVVYGFLIFFWYKLFEAVAPYLKIMNLLIGVLGVSGGIYFFRQFLKARKDSLVCDSAGGQKV